jgi:CheY-like chemotaxis protein
MNSSFVQLAGLVDHIQHMLIANLSVLIAAMLLIVLCAMLLAALAARVPALREGGSQAEPAAPMAMPPKQQLASAQARPWQAGPPQNRQRSILLVDDSAVARARLLRLFGSAGYEAVAVCDGAQALEALSRAHFSVLVTDLEMPNLDGFELIAAVQGSLETEDIPIIAITGHDELQARVHELGGLYGIFKKPWNDRELLRRVHSLAAVRESHAAAEAA